MLSTTAIFPSIIGETGPRMEYSPTVSENTGAISVCIDSWLFERRLAYLHLFTMKSILTVYLKCID